MRVVMVVNALRDIRVGRDGKIVLAPLERRC
jgi:hypothetical protein